MLAHKDINTLQLWLNEQNDEKIRNWIRGYQSKIDAFRANKEEAEVKTQTMIGFSCEDFFDRKNGITEMPLTEYIDKLLALVADV